MHLVCSWTLVWHDSFVSTHSSSSSRLSTIQALNLFRRLFADWLFDNQPFLISRITIVTDSVYLWLVWCHFSVIIVCCHPLNICFTYSSSSVSWNYLFKALMSWTDTALGVKKYFICLTWKNGWDLTYFKTGLWIVLCECIPLTDVLVRSRRWQMKFYLRDNHYLWEDEPIHKTFLILWTVS